MKNLTPMQAAYWTGRQAKGFLGNVSAHLYVEFECGPIDPRRFGAALEKLYSAHDMMRVKISSDGHQVIGNAEKSISYQVEDLTGLESDAVVRRLETKRQEWTGRTLDLEAGQTSAFGLTLLPGGGARMHVDTDMVAIDPPSFCLLMEDLAQLYEDPDLQPDKDQSRYFDWLTRKAADSDLADRQSNDKRWWQARLADIAPAPNLPQTTPNQPVHSSRLATVLSPEQRQSLERRARVLKITPSALMLGLFAAVIGEATGDERFRLNVPMFWRTPFDLDVDRIVGDFSNILILSVDPPSELELGTFCEHIAEQMRDLLAHSTYPGVSVMRDLSRQKQSLQSAPIVFTSGLDVPGGDLFSERVTRLFGPMIWAVSQGPQVALDAQVAGLDGGLLINWDIRLDALPEAWIKAVFGKYVTLVSRLAEDPETLKGRVFAHKVQQSPHSPQYTETTQMLQALVERLAPGTVPGEHARFREIGLSHDDLADLMTFLNRYVPAANLTKDDLAPDSTIDTAASLIGHRSGGRSEKVARAYLSSIAPEKTDQRHAQPAE
ncbi:condensation domain-containing protein [Roseibium sp.]|uniref:condensation domain-containing protein n=1 Tax=Roseibium sp. TaxID=1936156 RepID=UPI003BB08873